MPYVYELAILNAITSATLAVTAIVRRRQSLAQWAFAAGMLLIAARSGCDAWINGAFDEAGMIRAQLWSLAFAGLMPAPWLLFSLAYSRGNGREFVSRWKWTLAASVLVPCAIIFTWTDHLVAGVAVPSASEPAVIAYGFGGVVLHGFILVSMIVITMNLERTYRASVGTLRWRIKFMLLGLTVLNSVQFYISSQVVLFHATSTSLQAIRSVALLVACLCLGRSFLRPGQFSIDLHPSHSAIYGSITLFLAGAYLVVVGVLARIVAHFGGDSAFPIRALVLFLGLVGLAVVLQSDRARMRLRRFVSRHFQRPLFDYRKMWQRFAEGMASAADADGISRAAVRLIASSFEVQSVCLWIANERRDTLTLAASTLIDTPQHESTRVRIERVAEAIAYFEAHPEAANIETATIPGAAELRAEHASQFPSGGHRLCVPLVARGSLIGVVTLSDRVSGAPYTVHEYDMFHCVGDHVAAALLGAQLSERLARAREFEAFQTMAAFFVHDLKNAANTLSLLLQNLPEHFQDPEFREDAMRSCSRTVGHINGLIEKLGALRGGLSLKTTPTDLNALVRRSIEEWPAGSAVALDHDLAPLPPVSLDADQFYRVIANLVLNAREATPAGGTVRIATSRRGASAVFTVADTGCGMTPEFVHASLFRPFQTTKKRGLGIGMFQCKMIVEAHGGRIDVQSEPGSGSTFEVLVPLAQAEA